VRDSTRCCTDPRLERNFRAALVQRNTRVTHRPGQSVEVLLDASTVETFLHGEVHEYGLSG